MDKLQKGLSRRTFLGLTWAASFVGLVGQAGAALFQYFKPRIVVGNFGGAVVVGTPDEFAPGTVTYFRKGRFYVSRLEDGGLLAMFQRCPHLGCTVPWREDHGQFQCPCHDSSFTRRGEVIDGPSPRPLDLFPMSLQEGKLVVDTSRHIQRDRFEASQAFFPE
jgi:cytochrome b6-f complex iron-sulfur subunit